MTLRIAAIALVAFGVCSAAAASVPPRVTLFADPGIVRRYENVSLFGRVEGGTAGSRVLIQVKQCGQRAFWTATSADPHTDGTWSTGAFVVTNSFYRARWGNATSDVVLVRKRATLTLAQAAPRRFELNVNGVRLAGKRVLIQRFNPRGTGTWVRLRSLALPRGGGTWIDVSFALSLPRGSLVRAVLPLSQARPCYVGGYSNMLRVGS